MKKLHVVIFACMLSSIAISQSPFTSGNLVVSRIGNGGQPLTEDAEPVYLDEYTPAGALIQSILLPTTSSGSNKALTLSATDTYPPGLVTLSSDKRYLSLAGFNATLGTPNSTLINGTLTARTIGLVDYNGNINTSTTVADVGDNHPYAAVTSNGTDIWACYSSSGLRYSQLGSNTSTSISSTSSRRRPFIRNGQLYATLSTGAIIKVGTGLPTTGPQTTSVVPGIANGSISQCVFADLNPNIAGDDVLYVTNEGVPALQKYSFDGSTWVSNGQIGVDIDNYLSITAVINGTSVQLYIIKGSDNSAGGSGQLVTLIDNSGHGGTFTGTPTLLVSAGPNTTFRGVALAPEAPSVSVSAKVFLQGAYNTGLGRHKDVTTVWRDVLNAKALNQPFNVAPFNYAGTESVSPGFFTSNPAPNNSDILDWVLLELRDATTPSTIVARKACFIREDGQVVDLDGTSSPTFTSVGANNYYIVLRHRNHLGIRSSSTVFVNGAAPALYDFTTAQSQAFQDGAVLTNPAMKDLLAGLPGAGTVFGMWGGTANGNNNVRASGALNNNDYLYIVNILLGGNTGIVLSNEYNTGDLNLDGSVRASGSLINNDYLILVNTILGGNTGNVYNEHL